MKIKMSKRVRNLFLCVVLVVGLMPVTALAQKTGTTGASSTTTTENTATTSTGSTSTASANSAATSSASTKSADAASQSTSSGSAATATASSTATSVQSSAVATTQSTPVTLTAQSSSTLDSYVTSTSLKVSHDGGQTWVDYSDGMKANYGDKTEVTVNYKISNTVEIKSGDTFTYTLPAGIDWTATSGTLYNGTSADGTYTIANNTLTITYSKSEGSDVTGKVTFDGVINASSIGDNNGGTKTFHFTGGSTYTIDVNPNTGLSASKSYSAVSDVAGEYDFVIAVTSQAENDNVVISDTMGKLLSMTDGTVGVYTDWNCTTPYTGSYSSTGNAKGSQSFTTTINKMTDGQTLYVKYRASGSKELIGLARATGKDSQAKNTATYQSTQITTPQTTDTTVWESNTWKVTKDGTANSDGTITWTIVVNAGSNGDAAGALVKDTLGSNLDVPSSVNLEESTDGTNWSASSTTLTWAQLSSGSFSLPANKVYRITYTTKYEGYTSGAVTYTNDVTVTPHGTDTDYNQTADKGVTIGTAVTDDAYVTKKAVSADYSTYTPEWETMVCAYDRDLFAGAFLDDTVQDANYQTMNVDSVKVWTDEAAKVAYTGSYTTSAFTNNSGAVYGFRLIFNDAIAQGTKLYVTYTTNIINGSSDTVQNGTYLTFDNINKHADATYKVNRHLSKSATSDDRSKSKGVFKWQLSVSPLASSANTVTVTDTLPINQKYVAGSVFASNDYWNPTTKYSGVTATDIGGGTVTFTISGDALAASKAGTTLQIGYETAIDDITKVASGSTDYVNKAFITIDGADEPGVSADAWADKPSILRKKVDYSTSTAPYANYTVRINPGALTLNSGKSLVLTDTMGSVMQLAMGTVKVNGVDIATLASAGYSYTYDPTTNKMTVTVPDATAVTLTYSVTITAAVGTTFDSTTASNSISLDGYDSSTYGKTTSLSGQVLESAGQTTSSGHSLSIYKHDADSETLPLSGAGFTVEELTFDSTTGTTWTVKGTTADASQSLTSGKDGNTTVSATQLRSDVVYRVKETTPPTGYGTADPIYIVFKGNDAANFGNFENISIVDGGKTYTLQTKESTVSAFTLSVADSSQKHDVSISKVDAASSKELAGATLTVTDASGKTVDTWTSTTETHKVSLAAGTYTLTETTAPNGYQTAESITFTVGTDGTVTSATAGATSGNTADGYKVTMKDASETVDKSVTKTWSDNDDQDGLRPGSITMQLTKTVDGTTTNVNGKTVTLSSDNSWAATISDLPAYEGGKAVTYSFVETDVPTGYTATYDTTTTAGTTAVTDTHASETTSFTATKTWSDANDAYGLRPTSVNLTLVQTVDGVGKDYATQAVSADAKDAWAYTWTGLPTHVGGKAATYSVKESATDANYTATVSGGTVTNTLVAHPVQVSKIDATNSAELPGALLTIANAKGTTVATWTSTTEIYEVTLPAGTYTLHENTAPAGYDTAAAITFTVYANGTVTSTTTGAVSGTTVTMTDSAKTTTVSAKKVWEDNGNQFGLRPANITLQLKRSYGDVTGENVGEAVTVTGGTTDASWSYDFSPLPTTIDGKTVTYTVAETSTDGNYTTAVTGDMAGGFSITNTLTTHDVSISKVDAAGSKELAGATLTVTDAKGKTVDTWTSTTETHEVTIPAGTYTLTEDTAPAGYDKATSIVFTVGTDGTVTSTTTGAASGTTVTMTDKLTSRTVEVSKVDLTSGKEVAGAQLEVKGTQANGQAVDLTWKSEANVDHEVTLTAGTYTLTETTAPNGYQTAESITFTVGTDGTVTSTTAGATSGNTADGYKVTMKDARVTTAKTVTKVWKDANDQDGARPASVEVSLLANGATVATATLSATNGWTATFSDLPTYTEAGTALTYTVTEGGVANYTGAITASGNAFTITNTHTPGVTTYTASKTWSDDEDAAGLRPGSVELTLVQTVGGTSTDYAAKTATAADGWTCTWTGLPTHVGGKQATYSVRESSTDANYTASVAGATITNTLVKHDVNISKVDVAGAELAGAKLTVTDASGKTVDSWTSTSDTHKVTVPAGTYTLTEVAQPANYDKADSIAFTVDSNGVVKVGDTDVSGKVTMTDAYSNHDVSISKVDVASGNELKNAELSITGTTLGKESFSTNWTSDGTERVVSLQPGTYTLTETTAPDGYQKAESITFTIDKTGTVTSTTAGATSGNTTDGYKVTMKDASETTSVSVTKTWSDGDNYDGIRPSSVTVHLSANGDQVQTATLSASNNWSATWSNLPEYRDGAKIAYTVSEDAVAGYSTSIVSSLAGTTFAITNSHTPNYPITPQSPDTPEYPDYPDTPGTPDTPDTPEEGEVIEDNATPLAAKTADFLLNNAIPLSALAIASLGIAVFAKRRRDEADEESHN